MIQELHTYIFLGLLIINSLLGVFVHFFAINNRVHGDHGRGLAESPRGLTGEEAAELNRRVARLVNVVIPVAIAGALVLLWFIIPGVVVPVWAKALAVAALAGSMLPMSRAAALVSGKTKPRR